MPAQTFQLVAVVDRLQEAVAAVRMRVRGAPAEDDGRLGRRLADVVHSLPAPERRAFHQALVQGDAADGEALPYWLPQLEAAVRRYEQVVKNSGLAPSTRRAYLTHLNNFIRWLQGDFTPGGGHS